MIRDNIYHDRYDPKTAQRSPKSVEDGDGQMKDTYPSKLLENIIKPTLIGNISKTYKLSYKPLAAFKLYWKLNPNYSNS